MAFSSREEQNPQFEFEGYRVRLASGASHFEGDSHAMPEQLLPGIWAELGEENYRLIGDSLFTIDAAAKKPGLLSGISPRLHIELSFQEPEQWREKNYVVLILDNERTSLIDWAVANPGPDINAFAEQAPGSIAIYFDIPLIPASRESFRPASQEIAPDQRFALLDQASRWEENDQLTFGVFSFEDKEMFYRSAHFFPVWHPHWLHSVIRDEAFGLIDFIAEKADRYLKHNTGGEEQLQIIRNDGRIDEVTPAELQQMQGNKALLLCHGILSSTEGAFSEILGKDPSFLASLHQKYDGNILAWDHYTLSKTTARNAADLLAMLPGLQQVDLDILCHSRGAGVVRNLVENPGNQSQLRQQGINVRKIVFVAGACLGSQLADAKNTNRLFRRLNMLYWCFGGTPTGFIRGILTILKLLATLAQRMPGVEAMNPEGKQIETLNSYGSTAAGQYRYIMANFDFRFLPAKLLEEFLWDSGVFEGNANDLVVPYEGASASNLYLPHFPGKGNQWSYGSATSGQPEVMHINFFSQPATKNQLALLLP